MNVGFVMLVHTALDRAAEVARHWAENGCPVVIHADRAVPASVFEPFRAALADLDNVDFSVRRWRCEWGSWGIVGATVAAVEQMLAEHPDVTHVYLASGSCLPLRPVRELKAYLSDRPCTDFIESVTIGDVTWSKGGFDIERFTLRFPLSYRRHRNLFDRLVRLQRRLGLYRTLPDGLVPHLGSQWWCLTRETLERILQDPRRRRIDRFFRQVWIPDESYFQSLVRIHSTNLESRSLTLSKFDHRGKPHTFYDDHLQLLRRSECFVARKIWPRADWLYDHFLSGDPTDSRNVEPNPGKIDRLFSKASEQRIRGRAGLYMQSRFPLNDRENGRSAGRYSVFEGFDLVFEDFETWLGQTIGSRVHGHLFAPDRVAFADGALVYNGCLSDSARLRDYNPCGFLTDLIWNTRGERQCFMFGPADNQYPTGFIAGDPNAQISVITGAWALGLYRSGAPFDELRHEAARLQRIEQAHVEILRAHWAKASVRVYSLAEFLESPMEHLRDILAEIGLPGRHRLTEVPRLADLTGFGPFLQHLKNEGMNLHMAGDFPIDPPAPILSATPKQQRAG